MGPRRWIQGLQLLCLLTHAVIFSTPQTLPLLPPGHRVTVTRKLHPHLGVFTAVPSMILKGLTALFLNLTSTPSPWQIIYHFWTLVPSSVRGGSTSSSVHCSEDEEGNLLWSLAGGGQEEELCSQTFRTQAKHYHYCPVTLVRVLTSALNVLVCQVG